MNNICQWEIWLVWCHYIVARNGRQENEHGVRTLSQEGDKVILGLGKLGSFLACHIHIGFYRQPQSLDPPVVVWIVHQTLKLTAFLELPTYIQCVLIRIWGFPFISEFLCLAVLSKWEVFAIFFLLKITSSAHCHSHFLRLSPTPPPPPTHTFSYLPWASFFKVILSFSVPSTSTDLFLHS